MEFYASLRPHFYACREGFNSQRDGILQCLPFLFWWLNFCFNSQRDGILRILFKRYKSKSMFQFPTGWNSTLIYSFFCFMVDGFNSQRDGILHSRSERIAINSSTFQFPTGWNSTQRAISLQAQTGVSIPNGMEFYLYVSCRLIYHFSFNSQRDGILQKFIQ